MAICASPRKAGDKTISCGQCINCRLNAKRAWVGRLALEVNYTPGFHTFATLTYNDDHLPPRGSLLKLDFRRFYDRLRKSTGIGPVRFFAVGEYGTKGVRWLNPHYHALLFGVDPHAWKERIRSCWQRNDESMGFVDVGIVQAGSIDYVANYQMKKLISPEPESFLEGREAEFSLMSKNPPIGFNGMLAIVAMLHKREGCAAMAAAGDVPHLYRVNGKTYRLTPYWLNWLRKQMNVEAPTYTPWELQIGEAQKDRKLAARQAVKSYDRERQKAARRPLSGSG